MIYSDDFLNSLRADPLQGTIELCRIARNQLEDGPGWSESDYQILTEVYALLIEISDVGLLPLKMEFFEFTGSLPDDCNNIFNHIQQIEDICVSEASKVRLNSFRSHFKATLGAAFCYEFSQGDIERVQTLINEIRNHIASATNFESNHRQRLLKRLEKLQAELHKKVSDLDRFWGLIGDAGVVLGKLGSDAKPIVDRIREVADIVWRTQARAEELPSGTRPPLLEDSSDSSD